MSKYPDNIVYNEEKNKWIANILPYASNVGAPAINPENIDNWKQKGIIKVNHHLEAKFLELKKQYQELIEEFTQNHLIYNAKFNFEPVVGEIYYLYKGKDNENFLSLISPDEWDKKCLGSFQLTSDQKWIKL